MRAWALRKPTWRAAWRTAGRWPFTAWGDLTLEIYGNGPAAGVSGAIDHIALDVSDIEAAYALVQGLGYPVVSQGIESMNVWENGVRYFTILGPQPRESGV